MRRRSEAFIRFSGRQAAEGATRRGRREKGPQAPITHLLPYLYRVVRNLALDWVRRPVEAGDPDVLSRLPATTATPEQTVLQRDQLRVLAEPLAERRITGVFNLDDPVGALRAAAGIQNARVTKCDRGHTLTRRAWPEPRAGPQKIFLPRLLPSSSRSARTAGRVQMSWRSGAADAPPRPFQVPSRRGGTTGL